MAKTEKKKMKWQIKLVIIVLSVILGATAVMAGLGIFVYEQFFGVRYETYMPHGFYVEDFDGLLRADYNVTSDKGQNLSAYLYHTGEGMPKGVIVFAHGFGGGGHNSYMDMINYLAHSGYYVFTYDATGNDASEGDSVGGLPQGVIDLEHVLRFVSLREEFYHLPVVLLGHSWGGYSVTNVLSYYPEVKAVVSMAGFNTSSDLLYSQGTEFAGEAGMDVMLPFLKVYEKLKFGGYSENTAMDGFANSKAAVMVIHSDDDTTVPQKYGYDIWYEKYGNDPRFTFVQLSGKGHDGFLNNNDRDEYVDEFNAAFDEWYETLPEDISEENFIQLKADYINEHLDRELWCNSVNTELFDEIIAFYDANIG